MKSFIVTVFVSIIVCVPFVSHAFHWKPPTDARLSIITPEASWISVRHRHGIRTLRYRNRKGSTATTQWPLTFRIESRTAVGFVARKAQNQEREALVLTDPDECFHLGSLLDDLTPSVFDATCPFEDETHIETQTEKFDSFEEFDNPTTGNDAIRDRLVDQPFSDSAPRNTPYLRMSNNKIQAVGPKTGGMIDSSQSKPDALDGYGYGADDDLASFVLMADIGGARVFDENFDLTPGVIRNMAGFINTVSVEELDGRGQTAITAALHPLAGVFEPIAIVDANISDPNLAGFAYAMRVDSGDIVPFNMNAPFPPAIPGASNEFYDELLSRYYPTTIRIRAVVVNGEAPDYIEDMDGNGHYTARDVEMMGYQLLTNEVDLRIALTENNLLEESPDAKCPPRTFIHGDLDGDGDRGLLPECIATSGASRSRRIPR